MRCFTKGGSEAQRSHQIPRLEFRVRKSQFQMKIPIEIHFPGFLNHLPVTSSTQKRISLNLELKCNEQDKDIFGL